MLQRYSRFIAAALALALLTVAKAQASPCLVIQPSRNAPTIDGKIAPSEWDKTASVSRFVLNGTPGMEDEPTILHVTYDKANLYIAARCYENQPPTDEEKKGQGGLWFGDSIEVYLQPDRTKPTYYHFACSPSGERYDGKGTDGNWSGEWTAKASYGTAWWDIEFRIPFKTIGLTEVNAGLELGANFTRNNPVGATTYNGPTSIPGVVRSTWERMTGSYHDTASFGILALSNTDVVIQTGNITASREAGVSVEAKIINNSSKALRLKGYLETLHKSDAHHDEKIVDIEPGATGRIGLNIPATPGEYQGVAVFADQDSGSTLSARQYSAVIDRPLSARQYWLSGYIAPVLDAGSSSLAQNAHCEFALKNQSGVHLTALGVRDKNTWQSRIPIGNLDAGKYTLSAEIVDGNTRRFVDSIELTKPPKPEWLDTKLGLEDKVLPPWTPVRYNAGKVSIWGRDYQFEKSGYPKNLASQAREILAGPIALYGQVDGKRLHLTGVSQNTSLKRDTRLVMASQSTGNGLSSNVRSETEFDGMIRIDTTLKGIGAKKIENLYLDIPFKKQTSTHIDADPTDPIFVGAFPYWRGWRSGLMPSTKIAGPFTPHIWIGNDDIGLTWFAESQKMWANADENKVIEIIPQPDRNILRIHFIDYPISASEELKFTFGLQATPVKKLAPTREFGMYSYYGAENKRIAVDAPNGGKIVYRAADIVDIEKGAAHVTVAPGFDPVDSLAEAARDPRGDADYSLFSVQFPNGDELGLHYGVIDSKLRALVTTGMQEQKTERTVAEWKDLNWKKGEFKTLSLAWGDGSISLWSNGVQVASAKYAPAVFSEPVSTARILLTGDFTYRQLKVTQSNLVNNETITPITSDAVRLLDTFIDLKNPTPLHAPEGIARQLQGTWSAATSGITLTARKNVDSLLERWKSRGIRLVHIHEHWTESEGYPKTTKYETEIKSLARGSNALGMQLLPYVGFQLGDNTPEFADYKDEFVVEPFVKGRGWNRGDHIGEGISYAGQYQNFMIYNIDRMIKEYGIGGLYMDGTSIAPRDQNFAHGAGYIDRKGKIQPSYPIFEYRKFFKRIRTVGISHRPDFWMDVHTTIGIMTPVESFADSIWKGEQYTFLVNEKTSIRDLLDLDTVRAGMGKQYGIPISFLNYTQIEDVSAVCAVLDMPLRLDGGLRTLLQKHYGLDDATWVPYWNANGSATAAHQKTYVSYWKRKDGAVLAAISNLDPKATEAFPENVIFKEGQAGILPKSIASDAISGERLDYTPGKLNLQLTPWRYRLVLIAPENVQPPLEAGTVWNDLIQ